MFVVVQWILTRSHFALFPHTAMFPQYLVSGISATLQSALKLEPTWASSMLLSKKQHYWYPNCLFIQFVKGFEWVLWRHSLKASWKQSHAAKKDEPPNTNLQPWVCYLRWPTSGEKASSRTVIKEKRIGSCLTEGGNRQLAASFRSAGWERWWRMEVGWKKRKPMFILWDQARFGIPGELKNSSWSKNWKPQNTQWEEALHLLKFQAML